MQKNRVTHSTELLSRAFSSTGVVLEMVQTNQLGAPTPCASWDVRSLINHFVGTARWASAAVLGNQAAEEDFVDGDFRTRYAEAVNAALTAFGSDGVLDKTVLVPFGKVSGAELMLIATGDQFTHGWDLARAIGHSTDLDPELADELLVRAHDMISESSRGPDGVAPFGPIVRSPAGATPADRFAAFLGRSM
jgi:uncharacterized protein (TIGR03086 family)